MSDKCKCLQSSQFSLCVCFPLQTKDLGALSVIATNTEKFIAFFWRQFAFIDSLAFLDSSLDELAKSTPTEAFHQMAAQYEDQAERNLMLRKGIYPYEYMTGFNRFDEPALPPQDAFYSSLSGAVSVCTGFAICFNHGGVSFYTWLVLLLFMHLCMLFLYI